MMYRCRQLIAALALAAAALPAAHAADAAPAVTSPVAGTAAAAPAAPASAPLLAAAPAASASAPATGLDTRIQEVKGDVIRLNRDLLVLEEELLFPANTQVALFVSMDVGKLSSSIQCR